MTLEQQRQVAVWEESKASIRKEVSTWMRRSIECDPAETGFQQSFGDEVSWNDGARGGWAIAIPWQINRKIAEVEFEPRLPVAVEAWHGEMTEERRISNRLFEVARQVEAQEFPCMCGEPSVGFIKMVAMAYRELKRCYYTLPGLNPKPPRADRIAGPSFTDHWIPILHQAEDARNHDLVWAVRTVMKGVPKVISSFYVLPLYSLLKPTGDYVRVLKVISQTGKDWLVEAEAADYKSPEKMRELLNRRAGGSFLAGATEFQFALFDWGHVLEWKEVELVTEMGWHNPQPKSEYGRPVRPCGAWFFEDGAIDCDGNVCLPDKIGIITVKCPNEGFDGKPGWTYRRFKVSEKDASGTKEFFLGRPRLGFEKAGGRAAKKLDVGVVKTFFALFCDRVYQVVGSYDGMAAIGMTLAYAAAPEIFEAHHCFPGIWLNGEASQGKSTLASWLGRIYGVTKSCSVSDSTGPGTEGVLQQYSNLPPIFDEAQTVMRDTVLAMLKNAFNRTAPAKQTETLRRVLTMPIVAGIATSDSAQLRSRYLHITVASSNRLPRPGTQDPECTVPTPMTRERAEELQLQNYSWLEANLDKLPLLGRFVLESRGAGEKGFGKRALHHLNEWLTSRETMGLNSRSKIVHGTAYAGIAAMCECLGIEMPVGTLSLYREHLVEMTRSAMASSDQAGELDHFWQTLYKAFSLGYFGESYDHPGKEPIGPVWRNFFKIRSYSRSEGPPNLPIDSPQRADSWTSYNLIIRYDRVIPVLEKYLRERNQALKLRESDIFKQASAKLYWVPSRRGDKHKFERGAAFGDHRFWEISLDQFDEMGVRRISDEEWAEWKEKYRHDNRLTDPREGAFYQIVRKMEQGKKAAENKDLYEGD